MNTGQYRRRMEENQRKYPCSIQGCPHPRYRMFNLCQGHASRRQNRGHALAKGHLRIALVTPYVKKVQALVNHNEGHTGIVSALRDIAEILAVADMKRTEPGYIQIALLNDHRVDPKGILVSAAAVTCLYELQWRESRIHNRDFLDDNHFMVQLGRVCLLLALRQNRIALAMGTFDFPGMTGRKGVYPVYAAKMLPNNYSRFGKHLWNRAGLVLNHVAKTIITKQMEKES